MALEYGINFNTEEGRRKAEKEIKKWLGDFQGYLDKNKLDIGLGTKDNKGGGRATLVGYRKELQDLRNEYKKLTTAELASGSGNAIISKYKQLREQVGIYGGTLDQAAKAQDKLESQANKTTPTIDRQTQAFKRQSGVMVQLKSYAMNFLSVYAGIRMIKNLATITGEFEMQRVSLQAILQDAEKGTAIFERIKELAVVSPFQFKDLVSYTKQLSAFSVPYEELYDTTKMLADLSAGLGVGMDRLILAYGQVRSASVLRGQELRQFTEAGIPLVEELRKKLSEANGELVTTGEVFEYISARKVPFEMVRDIMAEMTSEGGKFYKMQEKQAETLKGKIANLADAFQIMMANIGESDGGLLKGAVDAVRSLIENYEKVGRVLLAVAINYGTYKASILAANVVELIQTKQLLARIKALKFVVAAQKALNAVMAVNPYVLATTAIVSISTALWALRDSSTAAEIAQERFNESLKRTQDMIEEERAKVTSLINTIKDETSTRREKQGALNTLQRLYPGIFSNLDMEAIKNLSLADAIGKVNMELEKRADIQDADRITEIDTELGRLRAEQGTTSYAGSYKFEIDHSKRIAALEIERSKITRKIAADKEVEAQAEFDALDAKDKIAAKEKENLNLLNKINDIRNGVYGAEGYRDLENIEKQINKNNVAIAGFNQELNKQPRTMAVVMEEYRKAQAILEENQKKFSMELIDRDAVTEARERLSSLKEELADMGFIEPTSGKDKIEQNAMIKAAERLSELRAKMALEEKKYALEVKQVRVDAMKEGTQKELAQIALTKEKDLQAIEERKQAMINANLDVARAKWESEGKKGVFSGEVSLTESQESVIGSMYTAADIKEIRSKELMFENLLNQYKDYAQKVKDIEEKKQKDIKNLNEGRTGDNDGLIDRAIAEVERRAKEETASLAFDEIKNSEAWRVLFSDLENYTVKTLKESLAIVEQADTSNLNAADAKAVQQAIDKMRDKVDEKNPFFALKDGWKQFIEATKNEQPDAAMETINRMIKGAEELLDYYKEFQDLIGSAFGENSDTSFLTNTVGDIMGATVSTGGGVAKILTGDLTGIKDVIKGVKGYINVFRNIRNRKYDKEIERQEKVVKSLEEEYQRLGKAMEDSLGSDYYKNATKQAENLKGQVSAISKQIEAEKKKGKDADKKKIEDMEARRKELMLESAQVVEDAIEKLTGTNLTSAAEDFAKAWMDAYVSFGDTTEAMRERFKGMIQDMVVNAALSKIMQQALKPVFDQIDAYWKNDGMLSPQEIAQLANMSAQVSESGNKLATEYMENLKRLGIDLSNAKESNLTGISKGISNITEDTALILGGYLDSIRFKLFQYIDFMMLPENRPTMSLLIQSQATMINHLQAIELNTNAISVSNAGILDNINKVMVSTTDGWKLNVNA